MRPRLRRRTFKELSIPAVCEVLEVRTLLTVFSVTTDEDQTYDGSVALAVAQADGLSLREAIGYANDLTGVDEIDFRLTATGDGGFASDTTISLNPTLGPLEISGAVTIDGTDFGLLGGQVTVDGGDAVRVLFIDVGNGGLVTLRDQTLTNGNGDGDGSALGVVGNGGAILIADGQDVTLTDVAVTSSTAVNGGGIFNGNGTLTIEASDIQIPRSAISGNVASGATALDGGGGLYNAGGTVLISHTPFEGNAATGAAGSGGGIFTVGGSLQVIGGHFQTNVAVRAGGGIEVLFGTIGLSNVNLGGAHGFVAGNMADVGGGLHVTGLTGEATTVTISGGTIEANSASTAGGGIWIGSGTVLSISSTEVEGNSAGLTGGAVFNESGTVVVTDAEFLRNVALDGDGGAIASLAGTLTVHGGAFQGNDAQHADGSLNFDNLGGAIYLATGSLNADGVEFESNTADAGGGAVATVGADLRISGGLVFANRAINGDGGGTYVRGDADVVITGAEITANSAGEFEEGFGGSGGGLFKDGSGALTITDSRIAFNRVSEFAILGGGGRSLSLRRDVDSH